MTDRQLDDLITGAEVARRLGISRQRIGQLRDNPQFPQPVGRVGQATVWRAADVEEYATGIRNLIALDGYPVSRDQAELLVARLRRRGKGDPDAAQALDRISELLESGGSIELTPAERSGVHRVLEGWLAKPGDQPVEGQLFALHGFLSRNIPEMAGWTRR